MAPHKLNPDDPEQSKHVAVRLDANLRARVLAMEPFYSLTYHRASISDILRALIIAGLEVEEPKARAKSKATRTKSKATKPTK